MYWPHWNHIDHKPNRERPWCIHGYVTRLCAVRKNTIVCSPSLHCTHLIHIELYSLHCLASLDKCCPKLCQPSYAHLSMICLLSTTVCQRLSPQGQCDHGVGLFVPNRVSTVRHRTRYRAHLTSFMKAVWYFASTKYRCKNSFLSGITSITTSCPNGSNRGYPAKKALPGMLTHGR